MDKPDEHLEWLRARCDTRIRELEIYKSKKLYRDNSPELMSELEREIAYFEKLIAAQKKK